MTRYNEAPATGPTPPEKQLPPGTYPAPGAPPATADLPGGTAPMYEEKPRRVGTVTMALALIAVGVVMVLRIFGTGLDYVTILRLSPLILVALGIELLIACAMAKGKSIRLDIVSVVISLLLIGVSMVAAVVPEVIYYQYEGRRANERISSQLQQAAHELTSKEGAPHVASIDWYVNVGSHITSRDMDYTQLNPEHYTQVRISLADSYTSAEDFAADCHRLAGMMRSLVPNLNYASFSSPENANGQQGAVQYNLWIDGPWGFDESAEALAGQVDTLYWYEPYGTYLARDDFDAAVLEDEMMRLEEERQRQYEALWQQQAELETQMWDLEDQLMTLEAERTEVEPAGLEELGIRIQALEAELEAVQTEHQAVLDALAVLDAEAAGSLLPAYAAG